MDNVVSITLKDPLHISINSDDGEYMELLRKEFTFFVDGYMYQPKYKAGVWDGKICIVKYGNTLPYGLLLEVLKVNKRLFPRITTTLSNDVKNLFKSPKLEPIYDLELYPYPYQEDCIEKCLKHGKGVVRSTTASGKSLMISYIIKTILENRQSKQCIIVVPTKSLVEQFYSDMYNYGLNKKFTIGRVYQKYKEWDKAIVIATWQTLMKNHDKLPKYETIICDETHSVKSHQLSTILKKSKNAKYRLGFTGTLHAGNLDNFNVYSFLGPIIAEYSSSTLAEEGYISKCNINIIDISYRQPFNGTYVEVKNSVFTNEYRLSVLNEIINSVDHNILLLVEKVEKEGQYLRDYLIGHTNKEVIFLSGKDNVDEREKWRKRCFNREDLCIIATYQIFSTGVNIPNLKYTVLASPFKSKIRVLQSIGRNLRKHENKEKSGAIIFDIQDQTKYLAKHGVIRNRYYSMEGFSVNEMALLEGDKIELQTNQPVS